jgi:2-succinyl-6-hydroxy-2,4-cyclohexadiene-1-carboxylate synthase
MSNLFYKVEGKGLPLLLIHGFTGTNKSFDVVSKYMQQYFKVVRIDLVGHGKSMTYNEADYSFENSINSIISIIDKLNLRKVNVLGYSLGGRIAMHLASGFQKKINKLILCSASYGLDNLEEKKKRINSDQKLINLLEKKGIKDFVNHWESIPLWDFEKKLPLEKRIKHKIIRLENNPLGLSMNLKHQGQGNQNNLLPELQKINNKTLILYGENDEKYENLSKKISNSIRKSKTMMVPESGHNIILENPIFVCREVKDFILGETNEN